jgi:hypothetical protein
MCDEKGPDADQGVIDKPEIKLEEKKLMVFTLEFDEVEINLIFKALGELPAKETYPLISKIAYFVNEYKLEHPSLDGK